MKLVFKTYNNCTYFARVPNYTDHSHVPAILARIEDALPDECIMGDSVYLHGDDWLTDDEHKQLDTDGKIVRPMSEVVI
jgi:hypothetical protein